jgi:hypothetical protein
MRFARIPSMVASLAVAAVSLVACGDGDAAELREELSALQTQVAQPSPTPAVASTLIPDTRGFCQAVGDFRDKRHAMVARFNELNTERQHFENFTDADNEELYELLRTAREVVVPLPPKDPDGHFERMNVLVQELKSEYDQLLSGIRNDDSEIFANARLESNALDEELSQLYFALCQ